MSIALSIASSGMAAASLRLNVSAANVANALDTGALPTATGPSAASSPRAYVPLRVDQVAVAGGGTIATVQPVAPSSVPSYEPTAPYADPNGMVAAPNVDFASEAVQQIMARYSFAMNAAVVRTDEKMFKSLLDTTS
jgi:flagellar basal-body rod protein FlgC